MRHSGKTPPKLDKVMVYLYFYQCNTQSLKCDMHLQVYVHSAQHLPHHAHVKYTQYTEIYWTNINKAISCGYVQYFSRPWERHCVAKPQSI